MGEAEICNVGMLYRLTLERKSGEDGLLRYSKIALL